MADKKEENPQTKPKRKKNYLNNKDLLAEVMRSQDAGVMSDKLALMLQTLTARYGRSGKYIGYTYNEDMQAYAMMMLCKTWSKFDSTRFTNAFAYYTQCINSSFIQFLNKERTQRDVRDGLLLRQGLNPSYNYVERHSNDSHYVHDEEDHNQSLTDMSNVNKLIDLSDD